jgi:hypothetical protein
MRGYIITSGAIFGLITIAHLSRMVVERRFATEPGYILLTLLSAGLCIWAVLVLVRAKR